MIESLRQRLLRRVLAGTPTVAKFQQFCGVTIDGPTIKSLHAIFSIGAALGNEMFFITFLPWLFWEWDWAVARRTLHIWASAYYIGQVFKDVLRLPRPPPAVVVEAAGLTGRSSEGGTSTRAEAAHHTPGTTPLPSSPVNASPAFFSAASSRYRALQGVVRLERHYEHEYGLPSTHAMNSIAMPWGLFLLSLASGRYTGDAVLLAAACVAWSVCCTLSRLYMGVHSPADIWAGLALGCLILASHLLFGHALDQWLTGSAWTAVAVPCLSSLLLWLYPKPQTWVSTPGDTAVVLGAWTGVVIATSGSILGSVHRQAMATPAGAWEALAAAASGEADTATGIGAGIRRFLYSAAWRLAPSVWVPDSLPKPTYSRFLHATAAGNTAAQAVAGSAEGAVGGVPPVLAVRYFGTFAWRQVRGMPARALLGFTVLLLTRAVVKAVAMWLVRTVVEGLLGQAYEEVVVEQAAPAVGGGDRSVSASGQGGGGGATAALHAQDNESESEPQANAAGASTLGTDGLRIRLPASKAGIDAPLLVTPVTQSSVGTGTAGRGAADWGGSPRADSASSTCDDGFTLEGSRPGPRVVRVPVPAVRRYAIELPVKLMTYTAVGINALYTAPWLFARLGLQYR